MRIRKGCQALSIPHICLNGSCLSRSRPNFRNNFLGCLSTRLYPHCIPKQRPTQFAFRVKSKQISFKSDRVATEMEQIQMVAGSLAGLIFAAGSVDMPVKAWRTKDLRSYSLGQIVLNNIGNLFYWLYVISLPFGPIYFMHGFFTLVSLLMLIGYFAYRTAPQTQKPLAVEVQ